MSHRAGERMSAYRVLACLLTWLSASVWSPAIAHEVPPSIVTLDIGAKRIDVEMQLPTGDLGIALHVPAGTGALLDSPSGAQLVEHYVADRFRIRSVDGRPYDMRIVSMREKRTDNPNWASNAWLVVHAECDAPAGVPTAAFLLDDSVIIERVVSHEALIYVRRDIRNGLMGDAPLLVSTAAFGHTRVSVDGSAGSWWHGLSQVFLLGMHHIAEGPDHLLFLLALLLSAPLVAIGGRWRERKSLRATLRTVVGVVTGFTLGHSVSLALASMGFVTVPTRAIEVLIAASILVACVHAWRPLFAAREVWIASAFGLIHGLAFAETLAGLDFDTTTLAVSLLGFNTGIEVMQLLVVLVVLPPLLLMRNGASDALLRKIAAAFAGACAAGWILERGWGMGNPLQSVVEWMAPPPEWLLIVLAGASAGALALLVRPYLARISCTRP